MPHPDDNLFHIPPDLRRGRDWMGILAPANWGIAKFDVARLRSIVKGDQCTVCVHDTGCDSDHEDFQGQIIEGRDFSNSRYSWKDVEGHGSHTAGTVGSKNPSIGVNPKVKLLIAKVLGDSGSGSTRAIAQGMRWGDSLGAGIHTMSLGSSSSDPDTKAAAVELAAKGVWIVAAAGNSGGNTQDVDFPGRYPETFSVAAVDANLNVASFSSAGAKINGSGPGVDIWSAKPGGGYQSMSGTSMATPFVAGVLSLYRSGLIERGRKIPTMAELQAMLIARSMDLGTPGIDRRTGPGALWPVLLAMDLEGDPKPVAA